MGEPIFKLAEGRSCGLSALNMALIANGIEIDTIEVIEELKERGETINGEIYSIKSIQGMIEVIKQRYGVDIELEIRDFQDINEFNGIITEELMNGDDSRGKYIMLPYYALQGVPYTKGSKNMIRGHWAVIYRVTKDYRIYAKQSNSKADRLGVLRGTPSRNLYKANQSIEGIKVDMGKYNKCNIEIIKSGLGKISRCGNNVCSITKSKLSLGGIGNTLGSCVYYTDLANKAFIININGGI